MNEKWIVSAKRTDSEKFMLQGTEDEINVPRFIFDTEEQAKIFVERAKAAERKAEDELDTPDWDEKYDGKYEERNFYERFSYVGSEFKIQPSSEISGFENMNLIHIADAENAAITVVQTVASSSQYEPETGEIARITINSLFEILVDDEKFGFPPKQDAYEELKKDLDKGYIGFLTIPMSKLVPEEYQEMTKDAFFEHILTSNPINIPLREKAPRPAL